MNFNIPTDKFYFKKCIRISRDSIDGASEKLENFIKDTYFKKWKAVCSLYNCFTIEYMCMFTSNWDTPWVRRGIL